MSDRYLHLAAWIGMKLGLIVIVLALAWAAFLAARRLGLRILSRIAQRTRTNWDDILVRNKTFERLAWLAPALVLHVGAHVVFKDVVYAQTALQIAANVFMIGLGVWVLTAMLDSVVDIYYTNYTEGRLPVKVFCQVAAIVLYIGAGISVLALLMDNSPLKILAGMGALTAVLMLVFKDTILGFVAGIQLSANDMVRRGDWIEMPSQGADGDVIDVALTTVKVQNWDKTITTIPTYALISQSFRNWRGMSESGGRRIKRSINIDMNSVRFCDQAMLDRFRKMQYITDYIDRKKDEIARHNEERHVDDSTIVNGRRLTNIGTFRAYVEAYLHNHPKIHQNMTFLVRQLQPGKDGLPLEIYVFSNDQVWANYEGIQADIFDHLLAVVPEFDLRVFQDPSGMDFQKALESRVE